MLLEGSLLSARTAPPGLTEAAGSSTSTFTVIVRGAPDTVALVSCGAVPSRGAGLASFSADVVLFSLLTVTRIVSDATSSDIGASDNTSATIGTSSVGVGVLSVGFSSESESAGKSRETASGVFVDPPIANEVLFSFFLAIGGDKVCSNGVGAASVSEPEVRSVPGSVPDDPFGGCENEVLDEEVW